MTNNTQSSHFSPHHFSYYEEATPPPASQARIQFSNGVSVAATETPPWWARGRLHFIYTYFWRPIGDDRNRIYVCLDSLKKHLSLNHTEAAALIERSDSIASFIRGANEIIQSKFPPLELDGITPSYDQTPPSSGSVSTPTSDGFYRIDLDTPSPASSPNLTASSSSSSPSLVAPQYSIHPKALKNLSKRLQPHELQMLSFALESQVTQKARRLSRTFDLPCFVRRTEINTARSLLFFPNGEAYALLTRKANGDKLLGKGANKQVYSAVNLTTGEKVALVASIRSSEDEAEQEYAFYDEFANFGCGVVKESFHTHASKKNPKLSRYYFLVERMKGDLWTGIKKGHIDLSNRIVRMDLAHQMSALIRNLHESGTLHRDLKPDNFLYKIVDGRVIVRLSDFGLAVKPEPGEKIYGLGTAMYAAPEDWDPIATNGSPKSDSFQLGMTLAIFFYSYLNFPKESGGLFTDYLDLVVRISKGQHTQDDLRAMGAFQAGWRRTKLQQKNWLSEPDNKQSLEYVIYKLLMIDPNERWTPAQALAELMTIPVFGI